MYKTTANGVALRVVKTGLSKPRAGKKPPVCGWMVYFPDNSWLCVFPDGKYRTDDRNPPDRRSKFDSAYRAVLWAQRQDNANAKLAYWSWHTDDQPNCRMT
jgi:hypothetical protein